MRWSIIQPHGPHHSPAPLIRLSVSSLSDNDMEKIRHKETDLYLISADCADRSLRSGCAQHDGGAIHMRYPTHALGYGAGETLRVIRDEQAGYSFLPQCRIIK